jgi:hypothetical protein
MPGRATRAGAGVRTGVGVPLGVDDGVALGTAVAVRVGTGVLVGIAVGMEVEVAVGIAVVDGVGAATATRTVGDGVALLAPRAMPSQPVRAAPKHRRIATRGRMMVGANRLLDNGDPPQDEMVADKLTSNVGQRQASARRQ